MREKLQLNIWFFYLKLFYLKIFFPLQGNGYSPTPLDLSNVSLSRELQVRIFVLHVLCWKEWVYLVSLLLTSWILLGFMSVFVTVVMICCCRKGVCYLHTERWSFYCSRHCCSLSSQKKLSMKLGKGLSTARCNMCILCLCWLQRTAEYRNSI